MNKRKGVSEHSDVINVSASNSEQMKFYVSSELMKNQSRKLGFNPTNNTFVVQDDTDRPMIFSIDEDGVLNLIKFNKSTSSDWEVVALNKSFVGYEKVVEFDVIQDNAGNITLAVALKELYSTHVDVFVSRKLSNDLGDDQWKNLYKLCKKAEDIDKDFEVEQIFLGSTDDEKDAMVLVAGNTSGYKYYYRCNYNTIKVEKCEYPENIKDDPKALKQISTGYVLGQKAIYFLYDIGETQTLECTTLADEYQGSLTYDYSPTVSKIVEKYKNLKYNCIATPTGSNSDPFTIASDIFIGSDSGIYLIQNGKIGTMSTITEDIKDVHQIIVAEDKENISVWAMCSPNNLYYIYGKKGKEIKWNSPILFSENIIHIAPIRNTAKLANEMVVISKDSDILHYWQCPNSTLWYNRKIHMDKSQEYMEFNSFTTHIHVEDSKGQPYIKQKINITSSEWMYVTINGGMYSIDKDTPAVVETDTLGNITIINMANDISSPIFHIDTNNADEVMNIYPNGKIKKGLQSIKSGNDFKNVVTQDGKKLLSKDYDQNTLNGIASNINILANTGGKHNDCDNNHVCISNKSDKHLGMLSSSHMPENFAIGMKYQNGNWSLHESPMEELVANGIVHNIISHVGDALHYIEHAFEKGIKEVEKGLVVLKDGVSFVIKKAEEGLHFVLNLMDKVLVIELKTLGAVFKAINSVLKLIGIDLEKILAWLGHLFGWTDILETSDKLMDLFDFYLDSFSNASGMLGKNIPKIFDSIEEKIADKSIIDKLHLDEQQQHGIGKFSSLFHNPICNWPVYHIMHGNILSNLFGGSGGTDESVVKEIERVLGELIKNEFSVAESTVKEMMNALLKDVGNKSLNEIVKELFQIIVVSSLDELKNVIVAIFELIEVLVNGIKKSFDSRVDIPLFASVMEFFMGGRKFTLKRVFAIILAIPSRLVYRITTGHSLSNKELVHKGSTLEEFLKCNISKISETDNQNNLRNEVINVQESTEINNCMEKSCNEVSNCTCIVYMASRFIQTIFADLSLVISMTSSENDIQLGDSEEMQSRNLSIEKYDKTFTVAGIFFELISMATSSENIIKIWDGIKEGELETDFTLYEIICFAIDLIPLACDFIDLFKKGWEKQTKIISIVCSGLSLGILLYSYYGEKKNRTNNLRFASNLSLSLFQLMSLFPFKVEDPISITIIVGANSVFSLTHIGLLIYRMKTDKEDGVTFRIV